MQDEENLSAGMTNLLPKYRESSTLIPDLPERVVDGVLVPAGVNPTNEDLAQMKEMEYRAQNPDKEPMRLKWVEITKRSKKGVEYKVWEQHWVKSVIVKKTINQ